MTQHYILAGRPRINWHIHYCNTRASDISRKKSKISRDFEGQIHGKIGRFRGIFAGKKSNSRKNRPISWDFRRRKVKIRRKIGRFPGILAEKSQFSKDFEILRKSADFTGNFGANFAKKQSVKNSRFRWTFFWQISLKSINFASI